MSDCPALEAFRTRFPEFTEAIASDERVQMFLDEACSCLNPSRLGACFQKAVLYYTAHTLSLSIRTTASAQSSSDSVAQTPSSGAINSSTAGSLSVGFASASIESNTEAWFQQTPYGQEYIAIVNMCVDGNDVAGSSGLTRWIY